MLHEFVVSQALRQLFQVRLSRHSIDSLQSPSALTSSLGPALPRELLVYVKPYVEPAFLTIVSGEIVLTAESGMYACPNCNYQIDSCQCACPYCAENESCDCAIGYNKATGG